MVTLYVLSSSSRSAMKLSLSFLISGGAPSVDKHPAGVGPKPKN